MREGRVHTIEIRVQAIKRTLGLIDHYFMVIDGNEYHPGVYPKGNVLPLHTTPGSHLACRKDICDRCYEKIVRSFAAREDRRIMSFYPLLNCESITAGISVQATAFLAIPFIAGSFAVGRPVLGLFILLTTLLLMLFSSKYVFSRTLYRRCAHLKKEEEFRS